MLRHLTNYLAPPRLWLSDDSQRKVNEQRNVTAHHHSSADSVVVVITPMCIKVAVVVVAVRTVVGAIIPTQSTTSPLCRGATSTYITSNQAANCETAFRDQITYCSVVAVFGVLLDAHAH